MALPAAVQKQVEAAEALQQQLYPVESEPSPDAPPVAEVADAEPAPSNVVELQRSAEPTPPADPPKPVDRTHDDAYWKQRFDTVQGILNAEVPRLNTQNKELTQQIQTLLAKIDDLTKAKTESPEPQSVTQKDVEDFGADLVDMTRRVAAEAAGAAVEKVMKAVADLEQKINSTQERVGQVSDHVASTVVRDFWGEVKSLVPDWDTVDQDPSWITFLDSTPAFAEDTYRQLAGKAIQKGDAQKIAKLVDLWRGPKVEPAPQSQTDLQRQVAPSTSRASVPTQPASRIWSRAEYEAAMDVRNIGKMGTEKADALAAEASIAAAEGRVRW